MPRFSLDKTQNISIITEKILTKFKTSALPKILLRKQKDKIQVGKKYSQNTILLTDLHPQYSKDS